MRKLYLALALLAVAVPAWAATEIQGVAVNRATLNSSVVIASGGVFQTVLASVLGTSTQRQALTIQNNNTTTDNCWVFVGSGAATAATSILLTPGGSYQRYWPFIPSDAIQVTCSSTSDTVYVDNN